MGIGAVSQKFPKSKVSNIMHVFKILLWNTEGPLDLRTSFALMPFQTFLLGLLVFESSKTMWDPSQIMWTYVGNLIISMLWYVKLHIHCKTFFKK